MPASSSVHRLRCSLTHRSLCRTSSRTLRHPINSTQRPVSSSTTQAGTDLFFTWLEDTFGGMLPMQPTETAVITSDKLHAEDLQRLFCHDATVLHVRNFYPRESAKQLGHTLAQQAIQPQPQQQSELKNWKVSTSKGLESSDVFTLGAHLPYNIAFANNALDEYFQNVPAEIRQRRRCDDATNTAKLLWPLDQLRLELDETWPHGASLASNRSGGLPRIMMGPTRWKRGFVHVDEMAPLSTQNGLFSANIYLQLPQDKPSDADNATIPQPVLEIWPLNIRNRYDWYRNAKTLSNLSAQDAEGQVRLRKALNQSNDNSDNDKQSLPIRVEVEPGDLVLICAQRPHCAIGFDIPGSVRVSLQSFLQYNGDKQCLTIEG